MTVSVTMSLRKALERRRAEVATEDFRHDRRCLGASRHPAERARANGTRRETCPESYAAHVCGHLSRSKHSFSQQAFFLEASIVGLEA